jgi:hypothetical protein
MFGMMINDPKGADGVRAGRGGASGFLSHLGVRVSLLAALGAGLICPPARAAAPVAADGSASLVPGASVTIQLAATDADGDPLSYIIVTPLPTLGTVSVGETTLASGDLPYTIPDQGNTIVFAAADTAHGQAAIQFKANDGTSDSAEATFTVSINRPPVGDAITPFYTPPATDLKVVLPVVDPDADKLTYSIESLPGHGRLKIGSTVLGDTSIPYTLTAPNLTYMPDASFHGQDSFTFSASDGEAASDPITVTIEVNTTPVPAAVTATVLPNGLVTIALSAVDADKDPVRYLIASLPDHGTLSATGKTIIESDLPLDLGAGTTTVDYKLDADYRGSDTFHYRAKDVVSISARAVVTVIVDTPPEALGSQYSVTAGATVDGNLLPTDKDGDALTLKITRLGAGGSLKLNGKAVGKAGTSYPVPAMGLPFSYTANSTFTGLDSFAWVASDGIQESSPAEVAINVGAPASPPASQPASSPASQPANGPTTQPSSDNPPTDGDQPTSDDEAAPVGCAPLGGGFVVMVVAWGMIIGPRSLLHRRSLARGRV